MKTMEKTLLTLLVLVFSFPGFSDEQKFPKGKIDSPYEACKNVLLVDQDEYQKNKKEWDKASKECKQPIQVTQDVHWHDLDPLKDHLKFLPLAQKVTQQVKDTLTKNKLYAECTSLCFKGAKACDEKLSPDNKVIQCEDLKKEVLASMKVNARKLRIELALAADVSELHGVTLQNAVSKVNEPDQFINKQLRQVDGEPNPVGYDELTEREVKEAKRRLARDHKKILEEAKNKNVKDEHVHTWLSNRYMNNFDEHLEKYRQILYTEAPVFAYIKRPVKIVDGEPTFKDEDIANAYTKVAESVKKTIDAVNLSLKENSLEFSRANFEAIGKSLVSLVPFTTNRHDLLYYMSMKSQVEEVLKKDPALCSIAHTLAERASVKQGQNMVGTLAVAVGSGFGGKTMGSIFRIGRALTGAEASALTGTALGTFSLADAQRKYVTSYDEGAGGARTGEEIKEARENRDLAIAMAPLDAMGAAVLTKSIFKVLGAKMAKDIPEMSTLMKKGDLPVHKQEEYIKKWFSKKIIDASRSGLLTKAEKELLESENGRRMLESLTAEIDKVHPHFFRNQNNIDFFLKAGATTLKRKKGDPADLAVKAKDLLMTFNREAINGSWDPKARQGLLLVLEKSMDELREVFTKDPATYAKFTTDKKAKEKVFKAALRKAGIKSDKQIDEMATCGLRS